MSVHIPVPRPMDPSWGPRYRPNQANEGLGPGRPGGCGEGFLNFVHEIFPVLKREPRIFRLREMNHLNQSHQFSGNVLLVFGGGGGN